jgi:AMMECR1 domain-containing protein
MAGEGELLSGREDPHSISASVVRAASDESRFREVRLQSDGLHGVRVEVIRLENNGELIAGVETPREDIENVEPVAHFASL